MTRPRVKAILGYDIAEGVTVDEYEEWLWDIHYPDLLTNPHLQRVVLDRVVRPITATSAGTSTTTNGTSFSRIAELHFDSHETYAKYLDWFEQHPIPLDRSPAGKTEFRFYVLCDVEFAERSAPAS